MATKSLPNSSARDNLSIDKAVLKAIALILAFMAAEIGFTRLYMLAESPNPFRRPIERPARKPVQRRLNKRYEVPGPVMSAGIRG